MGCHSGLSVSDVSLGNTTDWAQAITGTKQGGLFAGNTGYGLGDDTSVALAERLMALYAKALDGTVTAGRAMMIAKQQYLATTRGADSVRREGAAGVGLLRPADLQARGIPAAQPAAALAAVAAAAPIPAASRSTAPTRAPVCRSRRSTFD